jgi:hypothetical protein
MRAGSLMDRIDRALSLRAESGVTRCARRDEQFGSEPASSCWSRPG